MPAHTCLFFYPSTTSSTTNGFHYSTQCSNAKNSPATVPFSPQRHRNNSTFRNILNGDTKDSAIAPAILKSAANAPAIATPTAIPSGKLWIVTAMTSFDVRDKAAHLYTSPESHPPYLQT